MITQFLFTLLLRLVAFSQYSSATAVAVLLPMRVDYLSSVVDGW